jgi:hypothetical protein
MLFTVLMLAVQTVTVPVGHWEGKIEIPGREMGMTLELDRRSDGVWIGSVSIAMSTSIDVPLAGLTIQGGSVRFTANLPGRASFEGTLRTAPDRLAGMVSNEEGSVPFSLTRTGEASVKVPPPSSPLTKEFAGTWQGSLEANGKTVRVVLSATADGTAIGALVSSTGAASQEIPVTTVTIIGKELTLESRAVSGTFHGTLGASGEIAGEWAQREVRFPLTLRRR